MYRLFLAEAFIIKSFKTELKKYVADSEISLLMYPPVLGAIYSGLAEIGINSSKELREKIVDDLLTRIKLG